MPSDNPTSFATALGNTSARLPPRFFTITVMHTPDRVIPAADTWPKTLSGKPAACMILPIMPLKCNIDSRGKVARLIYGIAMVIVGIVLAVVWARESGSILRWCVVAACMIGGSFAVFEARAGWCVVRAMGLKTPI